MYLAQAATICSTSPYSGLSWKLMKLEQRFDNEKAYYEYLCKAELSLVSFAAPMNLYVCVREQYILKVF